MRGPQVRFKIVLGYKGSNDAALAIARGEMDALNITDSSASQYVKSNGMIALATIGRDRSRYFPNLPTIFEATKLNAEQEWLFNFRHVVQSLGRILVVPPGMSDSRLAFLEAAVEKPSRIRTSSLKGTSGSFTPIMWMAPARARTRWTSRRTSPEQKKLVQSILARAR